MSIEKVRHLHRQLNDPNCLPEDRPLALSMMLHYAEDIATEAASLRSQLSEAREELERVRRNHLRRMADVAGTRGFRMSMDADAAPFFSDRCRMQRQADRLDDLRQLCRHEIEHRAALAARTQSAAPAPQREGETR